MSRRPQHLDINEANSGPAGDSGRLTPRGGRPNFFMDLPSPRVGEVPPALSPLDAFALHSRVLARKLEESAKAGRRMSRLPHHEIQTELAKRPGYFRSMSSESEAYSEGETADETEDEDQVPHGHLQIQPKEDRPVSQYPFLGNMADEHNRPISTVQNRSNAPPPIPRLKERDGHGYFGIQVPRSSSPEPFEPQNSKAEGISPALPSLTSSIDSIQSSQPRTLTNESSSSKAFQGGLAPPRSPLHPRSARSIASIRSVIDSAEEDNGNVTGFEAARKSSKTSAMSNPHSPLSPDFLPMSCSPSARSDVSVNEALPKPSFNFSRPRSSAGVKLAFDRRPSFESRSVTRKPSNGSSLRDAVSIDQAESDTLSRTDTLSIKGPSRQNSGHSTEAGRHMSRQNSGQSTGAARSISRQNSDQSAGRPRPVVRQNSSQSERYPRSVSRQNSGQSLGYPRSVSRQNSGQDTAFPRIISRKNSIQSIEARHPISRQNSGQGPGMAGSILEVDVFSGDESVYGESRNDPRIDPRNAGAQSYIYSKYSLPRGRTVERNSAEARQSWINHQFKWEEAPPAPAQASPSKPIEEERLPSSQSDAPPPSMPITPTRNDVSNSMNRSRSADPRGNANSHHVHRSVPSSPSITSTSTDRTIRGRAHVRNSPSQEIAGLSPEGHLEKGIEFHNSGSLSKSTYHLRLAARAGLPTAMLLYALACRHGWGMRANQAEGVAWLKRAVDSSSLEFLADKDPLSTAAPGEKQAPMTREQKSLKAQFALAIYELGMSYMNGWGIPKDKSLALRCFEIAGSWGDNDALAEAGFCYGQGVGCKKDLKKAAGFYRRAADGGMSMAGQSWIYKPKYMDCPVPDVPTSATDSKAPNPSSDKAVKGRSRGKSFWRKKPPVLT